MMPRPGRRGPTLAHRSEYAAFVCTRWLLRGLSVDAGSNALAALARTVGPRLGWTGRVRSNLRFVWPEMNEAQRERLVAGVCEMSGRLGADYCNLDRIAAEAERRVELVGGSNLDALRRSGKPGILFSGHLGNWEAIHLAARRHGIRLTALIRETNNPLVGREVERVQRRLGLEVLLKGREGMRRLAAHVAAGGHAMLLVDVRLNSGVAVPFLGRTAMTPSAPAGLALRHGAFLVPVRTERVGAARFRVTVEPPKPAVATGDRQADLRDVMTWVNDRVGEWIRERPEQWFWYHRRWGGDPERGSVPRDRPGNGRPVSA